MEFKRGTFVVLTETVGVLKKGTVFRFNYCTIYRSVGDSMTPTIACISVCRHTLDSYLSIGEIELFQKEVRHMDSFNCFVGYLIPFEKEKHGNFNKDNSSYLFLLDGENHDS